MNNRFTTTAALLLASTFTALMGADGGCGEPPILDNNGFNLWCGNELCFWEVEAGSVRKAPTWHRSDFAAEFNGALASISQFSDIDSGNTPCLEFRAVADVDLSVNMVLEIDYLDNGVIDVTERIPTSSWARIEFQIATPEFFDGARFRIRKEGNGRAVLAEMQVNRGDKCSGARPQLAELPLGSLCDSDLACSSSICATSFPGASRCSSCEDTSDCAGAQVCGVVAPGVPTAGLFLDCMEPNQNALGTICRTDDECASNLCVDQMCSACAPTQSEQCTGDQVCERTVFEVGEDLAVGPGMCHDDGSPLPSGAVCSSLYDCSSRVCEGTQLLRCAIDRRECTGDDDCPGDDICATVAVADGTCR